MPLYSAGAIIVRMWKVATTEVFDAWFAELSPKAKEEVAAKVGLLKIFGPQLGRPHADALKGSRYKNMKELRAEAKGAVLRVAFAFDPNRIAILLVAGDKGGVSQKQFYRRLIEKADALFLAHLAAIGKKKDD